eukprot:TRINITY_DN5169_c0_g1_i1.p1 TRINITY_DN5169_c0_g1~~TRINITY_DN5169_c0_g1_i1.p1  ORF type:complete len:477 (-),score=52.21 TRINITY_DN5169_c0_g1_i1:438-1868(-)
MSGILPVGRSFQRCQSNDSLPYAVRQQQQGSLAVAATAAVGGIQASAAHVSSSPNKAQIPRAYSTFAAFPGQSPLQRQGSHYDESMARMRGPSPDFRFRSPRAVVASAAPMDRDVPRTQSSVSIPRAQSSISSVPRTPSSISVGSPPPQHRQVSKPQTSIPQAVLVQSPHTARAPSVQRSASCVSTSSQTAPSWSGSPRKPVGLASPVTAATTSYTPPLLPAAMGALVGCSGPERRLPGGNRGYPGPQTPSSSAFNSSRPSISGLRTVRARAPGEVPAAMAGKGAYPAEAPDEMPEYSEPSSNLQDLLAYLDAAGRKGKMITQVTYCVNSWKLYGFIPLKHHGFILRFESAGQSEPSWHGNEDDPYLTLDFSTRGILWDTFDTYPDVPEGTFFTKQFRVNFDPMALKRYCKNTKPFAWPDNDCKNWATGLLMLMGVDEESYAENGDMERSSRGDVRMRDVITCGRGDAALRFVKCM